MKIYMNAPTIGELSVLYVWDGSASMSGGMEHEQGHRGMKSGWWVQAYLACDNSW